MGWSMQFGQKGGSSIHACVHTCQLQVACLHVLAAASSHCLPVHRCQPAAEPRLLVPQDGAV